MEYFVFFMYHKLLGFEISKIHDLFAGFMKNSASTSIAKQNNQYYTVKPL